MTQDRRNDQIGLSGSAPGDNVGVRSAAPVYMLVGTSLRADDTRYRAIVDDRSELICRFLPDGTLTFFNEAFIR